MNVQQVIVPTDQLAAQREFYINVLGLPLLEDSNARLGVQVGTSSLYFESRLGAYPTHFAFDIPENKFEEAYAWISSKLPLAANDAGNTHIRHSAWNADSVYFYDGCGNNVELIARHSRNNATDAEFQPGQITHISEVGLVVHDVRAAVASLEEQLGLSVYDGAGSADFSAVGNDHGLLIVVKEGRPWFPDGKLKAYLSPVKILVEANGAVFELAQEPFQITRLS